MEKHPFPKRFSLKTLVVAVTFFCLCLGLIASRHQQRHTELGAEAKLKKAGAEVSWGFTSDVFEYALGDEYPNCVFVGWKEEGVLAKCKRRLTETVIGVEFEQAMIGKAEFQALHTLQNLELLILTKCTIDESALRQERLPAGIKWLTLDGTSIAHARSQMLSDVKSVEWLELAECDVTDSILGEVSQFSQLRMLDLSGNPGITDAGLERLSELRELRMLNLSGNHRITDAGLRALSESTQLRVLRLNDTCITHLGLRHLSRLDGLEFLELLHTDVTEDDLDALQQQLPNTRFRTVSDSATPLL